MTTPITKLMQLTQGERLARARKVAGLSQEQMADALGRDIRTIGRWERDQSPVSRDALIAWATVTEAPFGWLETGAFTGAVSGCEAGDLDDYTMEPLFSDYELGLAA